MKILRKHTGQEMRDALQSRIADLESSDDIESSSGITASVDGDYFDKFDDTISKYMPDRGEGDSLASQAVTAVNKLIYKWYNDGDVYDNTYQLLGWANDLSSYANWLYSHIATSRYVLDKIEEITSEDEYEDLLKELANTVLDTRLLEKLSAQPADGSIYDQSGPFKYEYNPEEGDDEYIDDDDEYGDYWG